MIESLILRDCGRRIGLLAGFVTGELGRAAERLRQAPGVAIVTGFTVPAPGGPAPETDGPIGAAALAGFLKAAGVAVVVLTDEANSGVCAAALSAYDTAVAVRLVSEAAMATTAGELRSDQFVVVCIERLGPNGSGRYLSMGGVDMTGSTAPFDQLLGPEVRSIGIGDGGNEIGMGRIPHGAVARAIDRGDDVHCVTPTDDLVLAGVSNWGAWGLVGACAAIQPENRDVAAAALSRTAWHQSLEFAVDAGAVDGVKLERTPSVDGMEPDVHDSVLAGIRILAGLGGPYQT